MERARIGGWVVLKLLLDEDVALIFRGEGRILLPNS